MKILKNLATSTVEQIFMLKQTKQKQLSSQYQKVSLENSWDIFFKHVLNSQAMMKILPQCTVKKKILYIYILPKWLFRDYFSIIN